jgi:hypothetical protein
MVELKTNSKYLGVLYTINGIYGEVTYGICYNIKNNIVEGLESFESLVGSSEYKDCKFYYPMIPSFSVRIETENKDFVEDKHGIKGLPYRLSMDDYFRMARLQQNKVNNSVVNFDGLRLEITKDAIEGLKKELVNLLGEITKEKGTNIGEALKDLSK